jgi:hypothetical protein
MTGSADHECSNFKFGSEGCGRKPGVVGSGVFQEPVDEEPDDGDKSGRLDNGVHGEFIPEGPASISDMRSYELVVGDPACIGKCENNGTYKYAHHMLRRYPSCMVTIVRPM